MPRHGFGVVSRVSGPGMRFKLRGGGEHASGEHDMHIMRIHDPEAIVCLMKFRSSETLCRCLETKIASARKLDGSEVDSGVSVGRVSVREHMR